MTTNDAMGNIVAYTMSTSKWQTWCWGGHVHCWCSNWCLSWCEQRRWRSHLTGRRFIPARLPLGSSRGRRLTHGFVSSVCTWGFSPATAVSWSLSFCLWGFIPTVFAYAPCGSTVAWRSMARSVSARSRGTGRCVAGRGVPHAGAGSGSWGLAALGTTRGFIPATVWWCVCRGVPRSLKNRSLNDK